METSGGGGGRDIGKMGAFEIDSVVTCDVGVITLSVDEKAR